MTEEKPLKPRKCPACGKDCVPKEGGPTGRFMGCPDFPKCPGKSPGISSEQRGRASRKLKVTYDYINKIGGQAEAEKWLQLALSVIKTLKEGFGK